VTNFLILLATVLAFVSLIVWASGSNSGWPDSDDDGDGDGDYSGKWK
jgi:hypothetical protein